MNKFDEKMEKILDENESNTKKHEYANKIHQSVTLRHFVYLVHQNKISTESSLERRNALP